MSGFASGADGSEGGSWVGVTSSPVGSSLWRLLNCDELNPGDAPSYDLCKVIYLYHPHGAKIVEAPVALAQSQPRTLTVSDGPEGDVVREFQDEWDRIDADGIIFNAVRTARIYGASCVVMLAEGFEPDEPVPPEKLADVALAFNVLDPLNSSGTMTANQDPNAFDFQKPNHVYVAGVSYHRSRSLLTLNEEPLYLAYTVSAFGYSGRSAYQRALFPLKSFVRTMVADEMIATKLGLLIAKIKQAGSMVDRMMAVFTAVKRNLLKEASTGNVLSIDPEESIETLNMQNVDGAGTYSRNNIINNEATAADMPAVILRNETYVSGFSEGSEDAKSVAHWVEGERKKYRPLYAFFDRIVMRRAWNPSFFKSLQERHPELYGKVAYNEAFFRWSNSFKAEWPSLLIEPDSERSKTEDVKLKSVVALLQVLLPILDPVNQASMVSWACDNFNDLKLLFSTRLSIDMDGLLDALKEKAAQLEAQPDPGADGKGEGGGEPAEPAEPKPFGGGA